MAHRTSSAAHHAAHLVARNYTLALRPPEQLSKPISGLQATVPHMAVLIDYATNVFEIALLRPELAYWQKRLRAGSATAPGIAGFVRRVIEALEKVPKDLPDDAAPTFSAGTAPDGTQAFARERLPIMRASLEAMRLLYYYFDLQPVKPQLVYDENLSRLEVAKIIDVSLGLRKAVRALPVLQRSEADLGNCNLTEQQVSDILRQVGVLFTYLPAYEDSRDEVKLLA